MEPNLAPRLPGVRVHLLRPPAHFAELATFRTELTFPALTHCVASLLGTSEQVVQLRHAESCVLVQTDEDLQSLVQSASVTQHDVRVRHGTLGQRPMLEEWFGLLSHGLLAPVDTRRSR